MEITEVRVKLVGNRSERLKAFCSVTFDSDFVVRDLKVIDGVSGIFVAMPSRKLADRCRHCGCKNHLRANHCNECGAQLDNNRASNDAQGRTKLHADVAHPINTACRERIQATVVEAYEKEVERSKEPDYEPVELDDDYGFQDEDGGHTAASRTDAPDAAAAGLAGDDEGRDERGTSDSDADTAEGYEPLDESEAEPEPESESDDDDDADDDADDYNSLIADLKREAADRRTVRSAAESSGVPATAPAEPEPVVDEPRPRDRDSEPGGDDESGGRSRGRRGRRGRGRGRREEAPETATNAQDREPEPKPQPPAEAAEPKPEPAPKAVEPAEPKPEPAPNAVEPAEPEPEPAPKPKAEETADPLSGFGAGIL